MEYAPVILGMEGKLKFVFQACFFSSLPPTLLRYQSYRMTVRRRDAADQNRAGKTE
jgi:hypothetical protein